ncbi:ATP-binding protein [Reichenbachiella sp. MALMAid0571]|uniref:ATP-binding protein n=1 Tax=Reichenbachiella sp. MALMAid0571 TaxID=3143939 RepID=UPI0032DF8C6B
MSDLTDNKIDLTLDVVQKGRIKVHTQIINDLSSGIYSSPASCIKELVNNSYDADAKVVTIRVKPVHDSITIIDDGKGMNAVDFDKKFAWISHSTKRTDSSLSEMLKRPLIGKIGIGFIAVNEICHELEITSTKKGEPLKFTANINFKKYFEDAAVPDEGEEEGIIKGEYELVNDAEDSDEHYTIIRLLGLKESVKNILDDKQYLSELLKKKNKNYDKNFFTSMKDLLEFHTSNKLKSFSEDNAYVQFIIDLASYIPVEYIDGGPIENANDEIIDDIVARHKQLDFKVDLDGIYLKKPIYFSKNKDVNSQYLSFKESIKVPNEDGDEIKLTGYFYVQHGIIFPKEYNGVAIRIKNVPISDNYGFDDSFMKFPYYTYQLFRSWVSGELYIEKGLEDAMNIDRKSFRVTHQHYLALQNFLHRLLDDKVFKMALALYQGARDFREEEKKNAKKEAGRKILSSAKVEYTKASHPPKPKKGSSKESDTSEEEKVFAPIRIVDSSAKTSTVEVDESIVKKFKKKDWEYLESIFLIFESAFKEADGDVQKLRKLFYQKVNDWKNIKN